MSAADGAPSYGGDTAQAAQLAALVHTQITTLLQQLLRGAGSSPAGAGTSAQTQEGGRLTFRFSAVSAVVAARVRRRRREPTVPRTGPRVSSWTMPRDREAPAARERKRWVCKAR